MNASQSSATEPSSPLVERRLVLCAGAASLLAARERVVRAATWNEAPGRMTWAEFLEKAPPEVATLARGEQPAEQDAYLYLLASLAARIDSVPSGKLSAFAKLDPKMFFGVVFRGTPFFVVEWRMEPGAMLPAHCHPQGSVCTVALEGEAELRHYEIEPGAPAYNSGSEQAFKLHETRRQQLRPGSISTLSATRDNVHFFRAGPKGARGIDITTMHGGDGSFSFIDFAPDEPADPKQGLYEALWIGQEPR